VTNGSCVDKLSASQLAPVSFRQYGFSALGPDSTSQWYLVIYSASASESPQERFCSCQAFSCGSTPQSMLLISLPQIKVVFHYRHTSWVKEITDSRISSALLDGLFALAICGFRHSNREALTKLIACLANRIIHSWFWDLANLVKGSPQFWTAPLD
jgi:hypothetical protein